MKTKLFEDIKKLEAENDSEKTLTNEEIRKVIGEVEGYDENLLDYLTEKCVACSEYFYQLVHNGDIHILSEYYCVDDGLLCLYCYESETMEPAATAVIRNHDNGYDGFEDDDGNTRCSIGQHINETHGDFEVEWHSTSAWRGYYVVKANNGWAELHSDCILSMSEDAEELKRFDEDLLLFCDNRGIPIVKVFARSSNLFATGYDLFVLEEHLEEVKTFVDIAKRIYRDQRRFDLTALTGGDPTDFDEQDDLLLKAYKMVMEGTDLGDVKEMLEDSVEEKVPIPA